MQVGLVYRWILKEKKDKSKNTLNSGPLMNLINTLFWNSFYIFGWNANYVNKIRF